MDHNNNTNSLKYPNPTQTLDMHNKKYGLKSIRQIKASGKKLDDYPPATRKYKGKRQSPKGYDLAGSYNAILKRGGVRL